MLILDKFQKIQNIIYNNLPKINRNNITKN